MSSNVTCDFSVIFVYWWLACLCEPTRSEFLFFQHWYLCLQPYVLLRNLINSLFQLQSLWIKPLFIFIHFSWQNSTKVVGGEIRFDYLDFVPNVDIFLIRLLRYFFAGIAPISVGFLFGRHGSVLYDIYLFISYNYIYQYNH